MVCLVVSSITLKLKWRYIVDAPVIKLKKFLLEKTDWTQLPDVDLTEEEKSAWADYRSALRNIQETNCVWPHPPEKFIWEDIPGWLDPESMIEAHIL